MPVAWRISTEGRQLFGALEIVSADHQNKPDVGSSVARQWYDVEGVELTHDGPLCTFDAFLTRYGLTDPALQDLVARIQATE